MGRRTFEQILREAKVDIYREYSRLYQMLYYQKNGYFIGNQIVTLYQYCAAHFRNFPFADTCISLEDFDESHGFFFEESPKEFDLDYLISFCEYAYNITIHVNEESWRTMTQFINPAPNGFIQQVVKVLDKVGYMISKPSKESEIYIVVPRDKAAIAVSEIVSEKVGYKLIEYNHHSLKGNLPEKLAVLKVLADEIEPKRNRLKSITGSVENELFQMLQKFVRHNNENNTYIASMKPSEIETCYDDIYQLWLLAELQLDNLERTPRIKGVLEKINRGMKESDT